MATKMYTNLLNMCRTCMKEFSPKKKRKIEKNQDIYEAPSGCKNNVTIIQILQLLQPERKLIIEDSFPTSVCNACVDKLIMIYEFIEMLKNTENTFHNMLQKDKNTAVSDHLKTEGLSIKNENKTNDLLKYEFPIEEMIIGDAVTKYEDTDRREFEYENESLQEDTYDKEPSIDSFSAKNDNEIIPGNCQPTAINTVNENSEIASTNLPIDNIETIKDFNEVEMKCLECEKVLDNIQLYQEHLKTHKVEESTERKYFKKRDIPRKKRSDKKTLHKCEHCEKEFNQLAPYKSHLRMHSAETPFLCVECGKGFKSISGLNTHMLRHKGEKTFQCPHCPKKFVCSSGLCSHMIIHSNKKPYVCNICGSAFHQAYELRHHNLYHEGIKKYKCEYCDKSFVTKDKQIRHMRTHTGEKPYRCKFCDKAFAQTSDCVKHLRQHLGDNVYQCELCPQRFPLLRDLRAHFNNHKDDDEETRKLNLKARLEEERNFNIKLGLKES